MSKDYNVIVPSDQQAYKQYNWKDGLIKLIEEIDTNNFYIGYARPGTLVSEKGWLIKKITYNTGLISVLFASGDCKWFNKIWDNRSGYTYK